MSAPDTEDSVLTARLEALDRLLGSLGRVVVGFSGGADSAFLAWRAAHVLGSQHVLAATAVSPSLSGSERRACQDLARSWGLRHVEVATAELDDPRYVANGPDRCAWCKTSLMERLVLLATAEGAVVVLGVNADDLGDWRPGQLVAKAAGARFPLAEAGLTKAYVREASRRAGLVTWDKPQSACLASRIPYGTPVTVGTLERIERAEEALRSLGFRQVRVRHHGPVARVELEPTDLARAIERREELVLALKAAGYTYVALDLEGFRSGSLNELIRSVPA
jgi:uncharacterized protein